MEQAVNLFNEGLLSDTNPMILGNKTLTDCLNGTLVTMNGNEIALQNDMGNIRIDNAYLPSGYEPVGIKEYGGVIYIAAYNPITNKSQIGSFPSPERRIDIEDTSNWGSFDFNYFSLPNNKEFSSDLGITVLKNDSRLIPLTYDDKTLHVGDKFVVYSEKLSELKDQISNYNNVNNTNINNTSFSKWKECTIDEYNVISDNNLKKFENNKYYRREYVHKVYSPKNKKYTLSLGILNEQNNFNDITSSLVRWNNVDYYWKEVSIEEYNQELNEENKKQENNKYYIKFYIGNIIKDLEDKSDLYKFNVGYFIPDGFIKDKDVDGQTISDTKLISERKKIAANTFSYKLSGPLYLKVNYNHVSNFYCNITGKNIPDNKIKLTLTARFTYNCPDAYENATYEPNKGDDDYYTYEILKNGIDIDPNLIGFDFFVNGDNKSSNITPIYKDFSYDKFNDVYYVTEELEIVLDIPEDHILEYVIGVKSGLSHNKTIYNPEEKEISYIKGLSYKGTINTDLLNSGELNLTQYKFYNDSKSKDSILQLGFEAYPKEGESFENLTLIFENIDSDLTSDLGIHYLYTKQPLINGQQIINFNLEKSLVNVNGEEFPFPKDQEGRIRSTYEVHIKYDHKIGEESTTKTYEETIDRWFLTTELFNDLYITNLNDYCNPKLTDNNELFLSKLKIIPTISNNIKLSYGEVKSYVYRNNEYTPAVYAINLNENILKLNLNVTATIDSSSIYINQDPYPKYIEFPELILCFPETNTTEITQIINGNLSVQLSIVYWPVKTKTLKDFIGDTYLGVLVAADDKGNDAEGTKMAYFTGNDPNGLSHSKLYISSPWTEHWSCYSDDEDFGDGGTHILERSSSGKNCGCGGHDNDKNINLECILTEKMLDLDVTKMYIAAGSEDHYDTIVDYNYLYIVKDTEGFYLIPVNAELEIGTRKLVDCEYIKNPNLFKISTNILPEIISNNKTFKVTCSFSETTPYSHEKFDFGNLIFDVKFEDREVFMIYEYSNKQIIEYYIKYINKDTNSYIDLETGYPANKKYHEELIINDAFKIDEKGHLRFITENMHETLTRLAGVDVDEGHWHWLYAKRYFHTI